MHISEDERRVRTRGRHDRVAEIIGQGLNNATPVARQAVGEAALRAEGSAASMNLSMER